ncbi:MAG TPA: uracil-DNA glycosylase [Candidatus Dormibacteraeota bacterium]|nr:uracil-DNA glycosylase [Candidatus Dormibacteraeota bacterium]
MPASADGGQPPSPSEVGSELERLHARIRACTLCGLHATRTRAVPGSGRVPAEVMIVGEAPGFNEDVKGLPFVGPAGRLLDTLLRQIGLSREEVYITNVLKCRPPQNRDPMPHEAEACLPYLRLQFKLVQPKAVLVLGRHALERMLPGVGPISRVHGQIFVRSGVAFMPCYHPAAALHNAALLDDLQKDFDRVREYLDRLLGEERAEPEEAAVEPGPEPTDPEPPPEAEQLSLI